MHLFRSSRFKALFHICRGVREFLITFKPYIKHNFTIESIYTAIQDIAPDLEYTLKACLWKKKPINCSDYFTPILTSEGLCFTFNAISWNDMHTNE